MPQTERPKTFSRKQRGSKKATCNDDLASSTCSQEEDKTAAAESKHDPYDFHDVNADRGPGLNQDSKRTGTHSYCASYAKVHDDIDFLAT